MRSRPAENIGLAASAPPDGFTFVDRRQPDRLGEDQLLVGERRVELGDVDRAGVAAGGRLGRRRGRRRRGQVAGAEHRRLDAVLETGDPGRVLAQFAGPVAGGQHDRRRAVGDRRDVVAAQRIGEVRPGQQLVDARWPASPSRCASAAANGVQRHLGHLLGGPLARRPVRAGPAGRRSTPRPATAGRPCTGRSAAPAPGAACPPRTCRSRRPARCRPRRSGS